MPKQKGIKIILENRKAYHDYNILEKEEAGIVLKGTEVKSLRQGTANVKDAYCLIKQGELHLYGLHISPYEKGNRFNVEADRPRILLMHKKEIHRFLGKIKQEGLSLIPLKIYFKDSRVKIELGLAKGKKNYDKRSTLIEREVNKKIRQELKGANRL